jgi:rubrerythrin
MKLRCGNCSYFFEAFREPPVCPNCGAKDALTEEKSAEDLINEIE